MNKYQGLYLVLSIIGICIIFASISFVKMYFCKSLGIIKNWPVIYLGILLFAIGISFVFYFVH